MTKETWDDRAQREARETEQREIAWVLAKNPHACASCKWWRLDAPSSDGYGLHFARHYLPGSCFFNPTPVRAAGGHFCGRHTPAEVKS